MQQFPKQVNIETLILVAIWQQPAIFQGCFKLISLEEQQSTVFLFFRAEYKNQQHVAVDFEPELYEFTHLYTDTQFLPQKNPTTAMTYAQYILKYALHTTILEMQKNQKSQFRSIDDEAMKAIIKRIEPMLQREGIWETAEEHIGFAVAMDFHPHEQMGQLAIETLFNLNRSLN